MKNEEELPVQLCRYLHVNHMLVGLIKSAGGSPRYLAHRGDILCEVKAWPLPVQLLGSVRYSSARILIVFSDLIYILYILTLWAMQWVCPTHFGCCWSCPCVLINKTGAAERTKQESVMVEMRVMGHTVSGVNDEDEDEDEATFNALLFGSDKCDTSS